MNTVFSVDDIVYIDHESKNLKMYMADGNFFPEDITYYRVKLMLNENFVRINKTVIVNLLYVSRIDRNCIILINDEHFEIEIEYEKEVTNRFYKIKLENFMSE